MKRSLLSLSILVLSMASLFSQRPAMTSWVSRTSNETTLSFRIHDEYIDNGYALCEVSLDMSAARCALTQSITLSIHENDGVGTYGTERYTVTFNPGNGSSAFSMTESTRILIHELAVEELVYARIEVTGIDRPYSFDLSTPSCLTSQVYSDSYDPNDSFLSAVPLSDGSSITGLVQNAFEDYFRVTVTSEKPRLIFTIRYWDDYRTDISDLNLGFNVYDASHSFQAQRNSYATSTTHQIEEIFDEVVSPGDYYFRVQTGEADAKNFYDLELSMDVDPDRSISGSVTLATGGSALEGITLTGLPGEPVTDASGYYEAVVPVGWSGTVTPSLTGYHFSPSSFTHTNVTEDLTQDYTAELNTYEISGYVLEPDGTPILLWFHGFPEPAGTDLDGFYTTTVPHGWSGQVWPDLNTYNFDPPFRNYSSVSGDQSNQDYEGTEILYYISVRTLDESNEPISDVHVFGEQYPQVTDSNGEYGILMGHGTFIAFQPEKDGYTFNPADWEIPFIQESVMRYFLGTLNTYEISGNISISGGGVLSGVTMNGLPGDPVTDGSGNYSATVDHGWSGTVTPALTGYSFAPASSDYTSVSSNQSQDYTAIIETYRIEGYITDVGGSGLGGVTVSGLPGDPTTHADGYYDVNVPHGWSGTATPVLDGYTFDPVSASYSNVTNPQSQDYTGTLNTYEISGTITLSGGGALSRVTLSGLPGNPVTDVNGDYSAVVDHGWSGTVTPTLTGYSFTPLSTAYSPITANESTDYVATQDLYLNTNQHIILLGSEPGTNDLVSVTSNVDWTVVCPESWVSCSPASGSNDGSFTITIPTANPGTVERQATVTVSGGGISRILDVIQRASDPLLEVSTTSVALASAAGSNSTLSITSNIAWTVSETADWLSVSPASGTGNGSLTITADQSNNVVDSRSATVTLTGSGITRNIEVTQAGNGVILEVSSTSVSFGSGAGAGQTVAITANIAWTASEDSDWLTVSPESGSNDGVITISAATSNEEIDSRSTTVTVAGSGISHTIDVTQAGGDPSLGVSAPSENLAAAAGSSLDLNIYSNIAWTASLDEEWLSVSPTSGTGNQVLTISADSANTETTVRMATLNVEGGAMIRSITINQDGSDNTWIEDPLARMKLEIYPNPSRDYVYLVSDTELPEELTLNVLSMAGKVLSQMQLSHVIQGRPIKIDLSSYPAGQYLIQIENAYIQRVFKVVKN